MGEPMLTKEQATKLDDLIHDFVRLTAKCAASVHTPAITRLALIKADRALTKYIKEITRE